MENPDKKREAESPLVSADFSEIEKRIMAWDDWHEGPVRNGFPPGVSPTGRVSGLSDPPMHHLVERRTPSVASPTVVNPNEES